MARGFTPRQYDFFSLLFGDEESGNTTTAWDEETGTEAVPLGNQIENVSEKGFLDAIRDSLNYVDASESGNAEPELNATVISPTQGLKLTTVQPANDDEEEISILDFFLNGDKLFSSSTTPQSIPHTNAIHEGFTNSPMHIQPMFPDDVKTKNETVKFALLPMSLYNMVKEDGTIVFDGESSTEPSVRDKTESTITDATDASTVSLIDENSTLTDVSLSTLDLESSTITSDATSPSTYSNAPFEQDTTKKYGSTLAEGENSTKMPQQTATNIFTESTTAFSTQSIPSSTQTIEFKTETMDLGKLTTIEFTPAMNTERTTAKMTTIRTTTEANTKTPITTQTHRTTVPVPRFKPTSAPVKIISSATTKQALSTHKTRHPTSTEKKSTLTTTPATTKPFVVNSNPSILDVDLNYDYSEPTLPPSLPNLKIIPFLPTDAVKSVSQSDRRKVNYNYYPSNQSPYSGSAIGTQADSEYSPFNPDSNPVSDKYPVYNSQVADDRIDYDTYTPEAESKENFEYVNIYAGAGKPTIDSKLDYELYNHKVYPSPSKSPGTSTIKNVLQKNPYEQEFDYHLYHVAPPTKLKPDDDFYRPDQYSSDEYISEHGYNAPEPNTFATIHSTKNHAFSVDERTQIPIYNYQAKNKFTPPLKTEGKFKDRVISKNCFYQQFVIFRFRWFCTQKTSE